MAQNSGNDLPSPQPPSYTSLRRFEPVQLDSAAAPQLPNFSQKQPLDWTAVLACQVHFAADTFQASIEHMILHPEYNSSTILRADILSDDQDIREEDSNIHEMGDFRCIRRIPRRIVNRRVMDWPMEENCLLYTNVAGHQVCILKPDLDLLDSQEKNLPYYYPQLTALAFRYIPNETPMENGANSEDPHAHSDALKAPFATLRLDVVPLNDSSFPSPLPASHRLYRTALALLKSIHSVAYGIEEGYEKRVHHDLLADKVKVQTLYSTLKAKYAFGNKLIRCCFVSIVPSADLNFVTDPRLTFSWLLRDWHESTDPAKHVFEDVAIASWLIIVWQEMYSDSSGVPPGGFVDVGCGNGLLVYLLNCEGFKGYGCDLRARKSWSTYNPAPDLRVTSLDPPELVLAALENSAAPPFLADSFLIFNHADELTPWAPLLAAVTPGSNFLNIPCCAWQLTDRFHGTSYKFAPEFLETLPQENESASTESHPLLLPFYRPTPSLKMGRNHAYQLYLAELTLRCGFLPEREALRIPSTKNFGFLGRTRIWQGNESGEETVRDEVRRLAQGAQNSWKARIPEGKAGLAQQNAS